MAAKKPSRPWRLLHTTNSAVVETKHRSQPEAYREVAAEKQRIADGISRVVGIRVEKWSVEYARWEHFETPYPDPNATKE
ncbi:hypothetical protein [Streptomyces microflavus]|uniref:hypothetical protein n=1 Tax=Streptomyces microflavus TaxID=1919 RepID=UPI002E374D96|nr:hypothetical protein [Streptomyces microflavus]